MSMQSWLAEFYPQDSASVAKKSDAHCCAHSLIKWRGLSLSNLDKHEVSFVRGIVYYTSEANQQHLIIDGKSCALCAKRYSHEESCTLCPIYKMSGSSCERIWRKAVSDQEDGVQEMIALLEKTLAWLEAGEEEAEVLSKEAVETFTFEDLYSKTLEECQKEAIARKKAWMTTLLRLKDQGKLALTEAEGFLCMDEEDLALYYYSDDDLLTYVPEGGYWTSDAARFYIVHVFSTPPGIWPEESKVSLAALRAFERIQQR